MSVEALDLVIVGNGAAAAEAAAAARAAGYAGHIDLFADNPHPPYNPMLGTYYASGAITREMCFPFGGAEFYPRHGIRTHLGTPVTRLEPSARRLTAGDGSQYSYRACLVATGAHTTFPPVPGLELPGVLGLRSFDDAVRLKEAIRVAAARAAAERRPAHGVVLGASFAGVKVAEVLRAAQMNVTVVEQEACILPLAARPECACVLQEHLLEKGYALQLGTSLQRVEPADGRLVARLAGDAAPVEADVIVVCTGSRPTLDFLAEGEVAADAGLIVDEHLRTNVEGLYAAGDVAQALNPATGKHEVVALWANARRQGRVAGLNMAGAHAEYPGNLPYNITRVGDLVFASGGTMRTFDALEVEGQSGEITACAFANGRLTGFNIVGDAVAPGPLVHALARGGQIDRGRSASSSGREARVSSADASLSGSRLASEWARRMTWTSMSAS